MRQVACAAAVIAALSGTAAAQYVQPHNGFGTGSNPNSHYVQPYTTQNGTYVQPHYQTNPNNTLLDNYGTEGNYNPHNGQFGTRSPYR